MKRTVVRPSLLLLALLVALGSFGTVVAQDEEETLNILYWQAVSTLNPYLSPGVKDREAASLTLEPLAYINPDGILVPVLASSIPTLENGGVSEDLTTITWQLKQGVVFSDGKPFNAADVVFSWQYCTHPDMGCAGLQWFEDVERVEAVDDYTAKITFSMPRPYPYGPFVGETSVILHSEQFADCMGSAAAACTEQNFGPIGTGPYVVDEFRANDVVTYYDPTRFTVRRASPGSSASSSRAAVTPNPRRAPCLRLARPITPGTCRSRPPCWAPWKLPVTARSWWPSPPSLSASYSTRPTPARTWPPTSAPSMPSTTRTPSSATRPFARRCQ